ncbi:NUDIX domain-containing protein [Arthrobacter caoxuetaonis]|uniref:NUDIX domain-containing protein n=1 Tax=Arthrobacter caoxuetaonis TaxID=2886935 RepID=UPI001D1339AE|nr:NUDIX hydrolase [Arthrobacter caoxuetaonis]
MRIEPPATGEPPRPHGPRDPGDAWVISPSGEKYWGRFGAAGLLAVDPDRGVLLQHRAAWSHHGDTWGLPGGARHQHEGAEAAALRESAEEAGVPAGALRPRFMSVLDLQMWTYSTLMADVREPFEPVISDPESRELAWIPVEDVEALPLHPGFAASWQKLRPLLAVRPAVVVDAANVVGSVPDGWWKDRAGAAARLLEAMGSLASEGLSASVLSLPADRWYPEFLVVLEGRACGVGEAQVPAGIGVVRAEGEGDDAVAGAAARLADSGRSVTVVTSDKELAARSLAVGAAVLGSGEFRDLLRY